MEGKPIVFALEGATVSLGVVENSDSYLHLPAAGTGKNGTGAGMVCYFGPTEFVQKKKANMTPRDKKVALEAQTAKMKAEAAANDPYPGLPSMDGFGRSKASKDYGKGDTEIEGDVKKVKKAKKAAKAAAAAEAAAAPAPAPEPEPAPVDEMEEEGEPPVGPILEWDAMVAFVFALAGVDVLVQPKLNAEANPLLEAFEPEEVKYTHEAPPVDEPDPDDSDPDEEAPTDPGPQVLMQREFRASH